MDEKYNLIGYVEEFGEVDQIGLIGISGQSGETVKINFPLYQLEVIIKKLSEYLPCEESGIDE